MKRELTPNKIVYSYQENKSKMTIKHWFLSSAVALADVTTPKYELNQEYDGYLCYSWGSRVAEYSKGIKTAVLVTYQFYKKEEEGKWKDSDDLNNNDFLN